MGEGTSDTTIHVAVPASARAFVDGEVERGGFGSRAEYIAKLIQDAHERKEEQDRLEEDLLDGVNSPASPWTDQDREGILQRLERRSAAQDRS